MGAWETLRGELALATDRDFERKVLPFLQLFWPSMVQPPERKHLDRAGIDLVVDSDDGPFPCVVQCKGLYAKAELDPSQLPQIQKSIDAFIISPYSCVDYVLIHNRISKDRETVGKVQEALAKIVISGKARRTKLWDRQTFIRDLRQQFHDILAQRLREESQRLLDTISAQFLFGRVYVKTVPVSEHEISLRRGLPPDIRQVRDSTVQPVPDLVLSPATTRWTLLTGQFGTGKSTVALHAASTATKSVIYTRCSEMGLDRGGVGTNILLQRVVSSLRLFEDFDDQTRERLERLAGPELRYELCKQDCTYVLVIDGLDENRSFASPSGMSALASVLSELKCPIILTTRDEHFKATFGNFDYVLSDFSLKGGPSRTGRVFRLERWGDEQIIEFIEQAIKDANGSTRHLLTRLLSQFKANKTPWPRDLFSHPLFLQMIVELAAEGGSGASNSADTMTQWLHRKISRDLEVDRPVPAPVIDRTTFIEQMLRLMERVAASMVQTDGDAMVLTENAEQGLVLREASEVFHVPIADIAVVVGSSVLEPVSYRRRTNVPIRFTHRAFQEYSLARHLRRQRIDPAVYPSTIRVLYDEMNDFD